MGLRRLNGQLSEFHSIIAYDSTATGKYRKVRSIIQANKTFLLGIVRQGGATVRVQSTRLLSFIGARDHADGRAALLTPIDGRDGVRMRRPVVSGFNFFNSMARPKMTTTTTTTVRSGLARSPAIRQRNTTKRLLRRWSSSSPFSGSNGGGGGGGGGG